MSEDFNAKKLDAHLREVFNPKMVNAGVVIGEKKSKDTEAAAEQAGSSTERLERERALAQAAAADQSIKQR